MLFLYENIFRFLSEFAKNHKNNYLSKQQQQQQS